MLPLPFQLEQLQGSLYSTEEGEPEEPQLLVDNFRAPQELNQRLVLSSFPRGEQRGGKGPCTPTVAPGAPAGHEVLALTPAFPLQSHRDTPQVRPGREAGLGGHPRTPLTAPGRHTGEVIAIIFGAVAGCVGLFLAVHFGAKRMR